MSSWWDNPIPDDCEMCGITESDKIEIFFCHKCEQYYCKTHIPEIEHACFGAVELDG